MNLLSNTLILSKNREIYGNNYTPIPSSILINEQIAEETPDEDEDENEEMIEVIDESTNEVDVNEDIVSKKMKWKNIFEDMADMDFDENEEERPIDDDDILI